MSRTLVGVAALAAFIAYCFHRGAGASGAKAEVKDELPRWEGEGGNVPAAATPSSEPVPQSSYQGPGSDARH
jgi:hypothetical protein